MLQCGFRVRMTQVCLDVLDGRDLSHIRRTRPSEHLVRHAGDPGLFASFLQDPEKEIVGIDGGPSPDGKFRIRLASGSESSMLFYDPVVQAVYG